MNFKELSDQLQFRYRHERRLADDASIDPRGGRTYCFVYPAGALRDSENLLLISSARCSPNDNFCKATGRDLSRTRALRYIAQHQEVLHGPA